MEIYIIGYILIGYLSLGPFFKWIYKLAKDIEYPLNFSPQEIMAALIIWPVILLITLILWHWPKKWRNLDKTH